MNALPGDKPWAMAVKAVIADSDGRQLLLRRSSMCRNFVGVWEWPGGKLDPGENYALGLAREVREECGLEVEFTGLAGASQFDMPAARVVLLCLHARITKGEPRLSEEHDDFAWVPANELAVWNVIPPMKPVIRLLADPSTAAPP